MLRAIINIAASLALFLVAAAVQLGVAAAYDNPGVLELQMFWVLSPVVTALFLYHASGMMWFEDGALAFKEGENVLVERYALALLSFLPVLIVLWHVARGAPAEYGVKRTILAVAAFATIAAGRWTLVLYRAVRDGTAHNHHMRWS